MVHCAKLSVWVQIFVPGMMPSHILWTSQDHGEEQKYLSSLLGFSVQHLHLQCYISIIQKKQVVMLMEFEAVHLLFKKIKFKVYSLFFNLKNGTKIKYRTHTLDSGINVAPGITVGPPLKNFHITILLLFYINLGIAVFFSKGDP